MTRPFSLFLALFLLFPFASRAGDDLLVAADRWRLPFDEGRMTVTLTTVEQGRETDQSRFVVLVRADGASRAEMLDPRQRGQRVLLVDDGLWLSMPRSQRVIRLTPLQRLMGQASYGDLARIRWARDYRVRATGDAEDGEQRLDLEATSPTAVYGSITLWVEPDTARPLRAAFFLPSGRALKTATFAPPETVAGQPVVATMTFFDSDDASKHTVLRLSDLEAQSLPAALFTVEGLRR